MLGVGSEIAHADCVIRGLRELLDPHWELGREPALLPHSFIADVEP